MHGEDVLNAHFIKWEILTLPTCRFWRLRHLPAYKPQWFLGNMLDIVKPNHHLFLREAANALGGIFRMRILWMQVKSQACAVTHARTDLAPPLTAKLPQNNN